MSTSVANASRHSGDRLPIDLIHYILSCVDSSTRSGRQTLVSCSCASTVLRAVAERALYKNFTVDPPRLTAFLHDLLGRGTGDEARRRAQERIRWIKRLELCDPQHPPHFQYPLVLAWEAAGYTNSPLFPNVKQLALTTRIPHFYGYHTGMPTGILLFGSIDVCVTGMSAYDALAAMPMQHLESLTMHALLLSNVFHLPPTKWGNWDALYWYDNPNEKCREGITVRYLECLLRTFDLPPVHLRLLHRETESQFFNDLDRDVSKAELQWQFGMTPLTESLPKGPLPPWKPDEANKVQFEWFDEDSHPTCAICGGFAVCLLFTNAYSRWKLCPN